MLAAGCILLAALGVVAAIVYEVRETQIKEWTFWRYREVRHTARRVWQAFDTEARR